jgi:hypothetical protein
MSFNVSAATLNMLSAARVAMERGGLATVVFEINGEPHEVVGVVRHFCQPDSCAFAWDLTPDARLRVTATFEHFIPLRDVIEVIPST